MNIRFVTLSLLLSVAVAVSGCASFKTLEPGGCGSSPNEHACLGKTVVPEQQADLFIRSSKLAIDAIASQEFKDDLARFVRDHTSSGKHSDAWVGIDASSIPDRLLKKTEGMQIATFGGIKGAWFAICCGTRAREGNSVGPILLNRWYLPRSSESIANTIVHEAAHRIGLTHPHSSSDSDIANCEPPYVIGSLVEKHITGADWSSSGHCKFL